ncbi:hypothetical protein, partial [Nonomuraea dietziae]|uniref:hypothetical protein n=1 Tax=Nonomuraea dietziae TaxID=65515 RepID=UPI0031DBB06E
MLSLLHYAGRCSRSAMVRSARDGWSEGSAHRALLDQKATEATVIRYWLGGCMPKSTTGASCWQLESLQSLRRRVCGDGMWLA